MQDKYCFGLGKPHLKKKISLGRIYDRCNSSSCEDFYSTSSNGSSHSMFPKRGKSKWESYQECDFQYMQEIILDKKS